MDYLGRFQRGYTPGSAPGGVTGLAGVCPRPAGLPHPWGATSCTRKDSSTYSLTRVVSRKFIRTRSDGLLGRRWGNAYHRPRKGEDEVC